MMRQMVLSAQSAGSRAAARSARLRSSVRSRRSSRKGKTRLELANAMFEYLEIFDNRQRRHSRLGMRTPIEYERLHHDGLTVA